MPRHLIPQTFASGAEPDPTTLPPGWLVIIDGVLNAVNDTQDGYDVVGGGGGGIAQLGHPAQDWHFNASQSALPSNRAFEHAFDNGDGSGYHDDFEDVRYSPSPGISEYFGMPQFGPGSTHLPLRGRVILRWIAPVAGTFNLDYNGEQGSFDITVTLNGTAEPTFNNTTNGTYTLAVPAGANVIEIVFENVSGSVTGGSFTFSPHVVPTVAPDAGALFYDEVSNTFVEFSNGVYAPVGVQPEGATTLPVRSSIMQGGHVLASDDHTGEAVNRAIALLGTIGTAGANSGGNGAPVVVGWASWALPFPSLLGYSYGSVAIGGLAKAFTEGIAIGDGAFAGPLGVGIGGTSLDESVALGYGASAKPRAYEAVPGGVSFTDSGPGNGYGVCFYKLRGVDSNGFPITDWSTTSTEVLTGENVAAAWPTTGWPTGVTDVQVRRQNARGEYTYLQGTVASGGLTDDFTKNDRIMEQDLGVAFQDWYGWGRARRSIAIGFYAGANHPNSVIIDNDESVTEYADQFRLGNAGNLVDLKGGEVRRVESVSASHTCDSVDRSNVVLANAGTAALTVTLPVARAGRTIVVKKSDGGANSVTVATPGAETIDGAADLMLAAAYETATLVSDGTNWFTI